MAELLFKIKKDRHGYRTVKEKTGMEMLRLGVLKRENQTLFLNLNRALRLVMKQIDSGAKLEPLEEESNSSEIIEELQKEIDGLKDYVHELESDLEEREYNEPCVEKVESENGNDVLTKIWVATAIPRFTEILLFLHTMERPVLYYELRENISMNPKYSITQLVKIGMVERLSRGVYAITKQGKKIISVVSAYENQKAEVAVHG
jgi:hypothetical protein